MYRLMRMFLWCLFVGLFGGQQGNLLGFELDNGTKNFGTGDKVESRQLYADLFATYQTWAESAKQHLHEWTLPNGIRVVLFQIPHAARVYFGVQCNVGTRHENPKEAGFAHMVEHMIFKGTQKLSESDVTTIGANYGTEQNACTSSDCTLYYVQTDKQNYSVFFPVLADCMQNARFDEQHFASEVKAVFQEFGLRTNMLGREAFVALRSQVFPGGHPYTNDPLGSKEFLARATGADMKVFYTCNYVPSKTVVFLAGNLNPEEVHRQALDCFGAIPAQQAVDVCVTPEQEAAHAIADNETAFAAKKVTLYRNVDAPFAMYGWRTPGLDAVHPWVADCVTFVLNKRARPVVERYGFADLNWYQDTYVLGGMLFVRSDTKHSTAAFIVDQVTQLACHGPTIDELAQFKAEQLQNLFHCVHKPEAVANILLSVECLQGVPVANVFNRVDQLDGLDQETVKAFCQQYLRPHLLAQIDVVPLPYKHQDAWELYRKQIEQYDELLLGTQERTVPVEEERYAKTLDPARVVPFESFQPDATFVLSNGLTVVVQRNEALPLMYGALILRNVAKVSRFAAQSGQGAIFDAMSELFAVATKMDGRVCEWQEHARFFQSLGIEARFYDGVEFCGIPTHLDKAFDRISTICMHPVFPAEQVQKCVSSWVHHTVDLCKQNQNRLVNRIAHDTLLAGKAPWLLERGRKAEQWREVTRADIVRAYKRVFDPRNFVLVLTGNIDLDTVRDVLENNCGTWQQRDAWTDVTQWMPEEVVLTNPAGSILQAQTSHERIYAQAVRIGAIPNSDDALALGVLEIVLQRELFNIRERTGLFYGIGCNFGAEPSGTNDGLIEVFTEFAAPNVMTGIEKIKGLFNQFAKDGITQEQLDAAKTRYQNMRAARYEDPKRFTNYLAWMTSNSLPCDLVEQVCMRVQSMSLATVNDVAARYLDSAQWTVILAGMLPEEGHEPA